MKFLWLLLFTSLCFGSAPNGKLTVQTIDSIPWVDLTSLAESQSLTLKWNLAMHRIEMGKSGHTIAWTESLPWISTSAGAIRIDAAPRLAKGTWWVPLLSALDAMEKETGRKYKWNPAQNTISTSDQKDLVSFRLTKQANSDLAEIRLSRKVVYETIFHPPHFILRLQGVNGDSSSFSTVKPGTVVKKVAPLQEPNVYQISFLVEKGVEEAEVLERDSGLALQIVFRKPNSESTPVQASEPAKPVKKKVRTVIIDPGHGGKDPGALGKKIYEKDVVLAVGKKLRDKLRRLGLAAKMTREDDTFIELQDRPVMASKWQGDLFISLHCNAVDGEERRKKTDGFRIYILREAESEEDKAIARRENKAAELSTKKSKSEISPVEWILLENQLNQFTKESERLALQMVETYEGGQIRKMGSGAGQAGFMVLVGAFMPAALVELGFITNPEDEAYLASEKGQDEMAERLAKSVILYRDSNE